MIILLGVPVIQIIVLYMLTQIWGRGHGLEVEAIYQLPEKRTPGEIAYFKNRKLTPLLLQADILWAAITGYLRIDVRDTKNIRLIKADSTLQEGQSRVDVQPSLFSHSENGSLDVGKNKGGSVLIEYGLRLKEFYTNSFLQGMWERSPGPGIFNSALGIVLFSLIICNLGVEYLSFVEIVVGVAIVIIGMALLLDFVNKIFCTRADGTIDNIRSCIATVIISISMMLLLVYCKFDSDASLIICISIYSSALTVKASMNFKYFKLAGKGKELACHVEGLEKYMRITDREELAKMGAPKDSIEHYEELLPYAVALGCADVWQQRFAVFLREVNYKPVWMESALAEGEDALATYSTIINSIRLPEEL